MTDHRMRVRGTDDPINPEMGEGRFQEALRRMRRRIADGLELELIDSRTPGERVTCASWGMCSRDPDQWPSEDDNLFPADFVRSGRVVPRDLPETGRCPMDLADPDDASVQILGRVGCFHRCLLFQGAHQDQPERIRLHVLNRYDATIAERHRLFGFRTSEIEPWTQEEFAAE